jgi:pimeloyl-ACP methyl ester carboxylesterase
MSASPETESDHVTSSTSRSFGEFAAWDDDFTDPWVDSGCVLMQHGFGRNARLWAPWVPYFGRRWRCIRPDLPGCGRTAPPPDGMEYTTEFFVDATCNLLDRLGVGRVHYVADGSSVGIGASLAASKPERVASLTLISAPVAVDSGIRVHHSVGFGSWEEALVELGTREWWVRARSSGSELVGGPVDTYLADEAGKLEPFAAIALARWASTWDLRDLLPRVKAPTLFVWAEGRVSAAQEKLAALAPNGHLRKVPGVTSQLMIYTNPDVVAPIVSDSLSALEGSERGHPVVT